MGFVIAILTLVLVLDSLILIGLVLIQLPKKDTGGGLAFGGGASDALFGAGSGNVLTKVTKYAAIGFFALAILLSLLQRNFYSGAGSEFGKKLSQPAPMVNPQAPPGTESSPAATPMPPPAHAATQPPAATNMFLSIPSSATNAPLPEVPPATRGAVPTNTAPK